MYDVLHGNCGVLWTPGSPPSDAQRGPQTPDQGLGSRFQSLAPASGLHHFLVEVGEGPALWVSGSLSVEWGGEAGGENGWLVEIRRPRAGFSAGATVRMLSMSAAVRR